MSRLLKVLSIFLGVVMFAFGFLKFFQPFHGWFDAQIQLSHLPQESVLTGKLTEMLTGILFLLPTFVPQLRPRTKYLVLLAGSFLLFTQMVVAIYVHLQPAVPAGVLPLGIKTPYIPSTILLLGLLAAFEAGKQLRAERA